MKIALRIGVSAIFLLVMPSAAHADTSSLVWNDIVMLEGGTYSVPLNVEAPAYVTGPSLMPDGEFVFQLSGNLYKVTDAGREFVQALHEHDRFDDPDDPDDGDPLFAWPAAGSYELDLLGFPPPIVNFEDRLRRFLAHVLFADVVYAQFGDPTLLETIYFTIVEVQTEPDPVIIIPGILGSEQHNGVWVIDPILHTYDDLIATLDANGYTPEEDLFTFPYNWRKSNVETAVLLKQKIDAVKGICSCDKVDLVAHSMGGLVARQYIQSDAYESDVDQLIFLGTPHLGAPKAYLMWEGGETQPGDLFNALLKRMLEQEAKEKGYFDLFTYIRNKPIHSVSELLPIYDYIIDSGDVRTYPNEYPINNFLADLKEGIAELLNSGVTTYNFIGDLPSNETIVAIRVADRDDFFPKWVEGYPEGFYENSGVPGLIFGKGDSTVATTSAAFVSDNLTVTPFDHSVLPSQTEGDVYEILTGKDADVLVHRFINIPNLRILFLKILSPADLLVIAPDGSKMGKDFNGQEVNEIPNAFYTGFNTDAEFITILDPLDGDYKIYALGTGGGPYTVETSFITNATTTDASFTGNTGPGITSELNLEVENGAIPPGALDVVVTYKSTLVDINRIYALGWMSKRAYKDVRDDFKDAFKKKKKGKRVVDKDDLHDILEDLRDYREDREINKQGYQILKADIKWLIEHL